MRLLFVILASCILANPASSQSPFVAVHGVDGAAYQVWINQIKANGFRPIYVNGYDVGGKVQFAAVARKTLDASEWEARHGLTGDAFQKRLDDAAANGLCPVCVSGYLDDATPRFAVIFVRTSKPGKWQVRYDLSAKEYQDGIESFRKKGLRPDLVTGYADGKGGYRFAALFVEAGKSLWSAQHDLTEDAYQKWVDDLAGKGYRPKGVSAYPTPNGLRFAAVFTKDGVTWSARIGLTAEEYQIEFDKRAIDGYRPLIVTGYPTGSIDRTEPYDAAMRQFMKERSIPGGALAVSRDGKMLLSAGYGYADANMRPIKADTPFRLASVTKPITAAAVHQLIDAGKLKLDTRVFALLDLKPLADQKADARLQQITVRHLLEHRGGWDRNIFPDPMFCPRQIARAVGKVGPVEPDDIVRFMLGQPLQFNPGARQSYSNFGYCVLGRVVEKVAGKPFIDYVRDDLLGPLNIKSIELGSTLPAKRNPAEPEYFDPYIGRSVLQSRRKFVSLPDGSFCLEAMDANGGLIGSAPDLIRFLEAYWISGKPRKGNGQNWTAFGSLPGTWTMVMQRPNGVNVAALFNQRTDLSGLSYDTIYDLMRAAAEGYGSGPRYAAVFVKD